MGADETHAVARARSVRTCITSERCKVVKDGFAEEIGKQFSGGVLVAFA